MIWKYLCSALAGAAVGAWLVVGLWGMHGRRQREDFGKLLAYAADGTNVIRYQGEDKARYTQLHRDVWLMLISGIETEELSENVAEGRVLCPTPKDYTREGFDQCALDADADATSSALGSLWMIVQSDHSNEEKVRLIVLLRSIARDADRR